MHAGLRRSPAQIEVHQRRALAPAPSRAMWASQARLSPVPWSDGGACGFFDHRCQPTSLRLFINPRRERERGEEEGRAPSSIRLGEQHRAGRAAPSGYVHPHIRWVIEVYLQQDQRGAQLSLVIGCGPPKPGGKAARACISSACTPWTSLGGGAGDQPMPEMA
jgi:hypothetical protein